MLKYLIILSLFVFSNAYAADFRGEHGAFFRLINSDLSDMQIKYRHESEREESSGPGELKLNLYSASFELPAALTRDAYLRYGGEYELRDYKFRRIVSSPTEASKEQLHKLIAKVGAGTFLNDNFLITGISSFGIYSDFDETPGGEDFRLFGSGELYYRLNPGAALVAGIRYNEDFDDTPIYPIVGLRLLSEDGALHISLTVPTEARIGYYVTKSAEIYGGFWLNGDEYRVTRNDREFDVHFQDRRVGLGVAVRVGSHVVVNFEGGMEVNSEFEEKISDTVQFRGDLDSGMYLGGQVGIGF